MAGGGAGDRTANEALEQRPLYNHSMVREELERRIGQVLASTDDRVLAAYLFGSVARQTDTLGSDVDLGVLLRVAPPGVLSGLRSALEGDLERALGRRTQVVVLNSAPPDLVHRVLRDGRLLLDRDRSARIRFEVRARNDYFDLVPVLERYRKQKVATS